MQHLLQRLYGVNASDAKATIFVHI